jgi:hypothetical protein
VATLKPSNGKNMQRLKLTGLQIVKENTEKPLDKFGGFVGSEIVPCFVHHVVFVPIELEIWIPLAPSLSRNILNIWATRQLPSLQLAPSWLPFTESQMFRYRYN